MKKLTLFAVLSTLIVAQAQAAGCMADLQKKGLTVGTSPDYPPYESLDNNNQIVGYDIDVVKAVGNKLGLKVNVVGQSFDGLIPALISKKIDLVAAGMTVNAERKQSVNFTLPVDSSTNVIMARKENVAYNKATALSGKSVGVQIGSVQETLVQGIKGANVKSFNLYTDAAVALQNRQIDSMILDRTVANQFLKNYPDLRITGNLEKTDKAFAVREDCTDVVSRMNVVIAQMSKNGELAALQKKWFK